jgi:hypothetical protein
MNRLLNGVEISHVTPFLIKGVGAKSGVGLKNGGGKFWIRANRKVSTTTMKELATFSQVLTNALNSYNLIGASE